MARRPDEPVRLVEDAESGDRFLIYSTARGVRIELRYQGDQLWADQEQMSLMFGVNVPSISRHIKNIYAEGELEPSATLSRIERVQLEGARRVKRTIEVYSLDTIISVGYRISSKQGTLFRRWATDKLVQFATKGFVIDAERLRDEADTDRLRELRDIIRDIRSSESNLYAELRRICSLCQDYDARSSEARAFYSRMQAKLFWAVTSRTPSEILRDRIHASRPNLGLQSWPKDEIRQQDVLVAKNALAEAEVRELNRLTTILLDIFDDQLELGRLTLMAEADNLLDRQLTNLGRPVLRHGGSISSESAQEHARQQYLLFSEQRLAARRTETHESLASLIAAEKALPKRGKKKSSDV